MAVFSLLSSLIFWCYRKEEGIANLRQESGIIWSYRVFIYGISLVLAVLDMDLMPRIGHICVDDETAPHLYAQLRHLWRFLHVMYALIWSYFLDILDILQI